jgi:hypothetical protein
MTKFLSSIFCFYILSFSAFAQSGTTGSLTWQITGNTLIISGNGAMPNYQYAPWYRYESSIYTVVIEPGVTSIGGLAFSECKSVTSIMLPNSITHIGDGAFAMCTSLASVTLPNNLTNIGSSAFRNCHSLTSLTTHALTPPILGVNAFSGVPVNISVYIPESTYNHYSNASEWEKFINFVEPTSKTSERQMGSSVSEREKFTNFVEPTSKTTEKQTVNSAYDLILLKDGQEIKANVTEITPSEIKYKAFENLNGPTRTLSKRDVFLINYANGTREVISTSINRNSNLSSKQQSATNCAKNTAFGLDMGFGGSFYANHNNRTKSTTSFAPTLGIRVMHHFNPYFGIDFLKLNWITDVFYSEMDEGWTMRLQIMPGIRGNSPTFFKCMSVYSAFRLGYGMDFRFATLSGVSHFEGLCLETELGLNLTPTFFAGFAYNCHNYFVKGSDSKVAMHTFSFRLGFNFGK